MVMEKTLDITDQKGATANISDIKIFGNADMWQLLCKASSNEQGWMKSTKALYLGLGLGCLIQVTTQQRNLDGTYSVAEAICHAPKVRIFGDETGRYLAPE